MSFHRTYLYSSMFPRFPLYHYKENSCVSGRGNNKCGPAHCLRAWYHKARGTWLSQTSETVCMIKAKGGATQGKCAEMDRCTLGCLPASAFCRWGCQTWKSTYIHAFGAIKRQPSSTTAYVLLLKFSFWTFSSSPIASMARGYGVCHTRP